MHSISKSSLPKVRKLLQDFYWYICTVTHFCTIDLSLEFWQFYEQLIPVKIFFFFLTVNSRVLCVLQKILNNICFSTFFTLVTFFHSFSLLLHFSIFSFSLSLKQKQASFYSISSIAFTL